MRRLLFAAAFIAFAGVAQAQQFPARPVTLIVPWPPGGSTDIAMRALASATEKHLGQSIVIENRPGAGSSLHITMEQIAKAKGLKWTQVPFKGGADNMNALLGGHIDVTTDSTGWAELVNAGKFRLLVTWGAARTKNWPTVPTLREIGIDMVSNSPFGIGGPKGMDPAVVKALHDAFKKIG